jgi:TldD protein
VANSEGSLFTQTVYESGGKITVSDQSGFQLPLLGLTPMGKGWELIIGADIPGQLAAASDRLAREKAARAMRKGAQVGRYTLVCDGMTMATLIERTLGIATQLDRALGYEANASGTSFLNDPLAMLGTLQVASPLVNITANRSAPGQLATVKWDDEGVVPEDFSLVHDGILVDYQTTREQAAWLAPYYQRRKVAVRSHGCAAAESALTIPMQHPPNLALTPASANVTLEDLIGNVENGILVTNGQVRNVDFQTRTGLILGTMFEIRNGRVRQLLEGGGLTYDTLEFWKHVSALGGSATQVVSASATYPYTPMFDRMTGMYPVKGEPPQRTSNSIQAVAATIANQTLINPMRKA